MNILISGCGRIGAQIASKLAESSNDHEITIIDADPQSFLLLPQELRFKDGFTFVGDGASDKDLKTAGIEKADVFIAVAVRDNRNALSAQKAKHIYRVSKVVCRVGDPTKQSMYKTLGLNAMSPTLSTATQILEAVSL